MKVLTLPFVIAIVVMIAACGPSASSASLSPSAGTPSPSVAESASPSPSPSESAGASPSESADSGEVEDPGTTIVLEATVAGGTSTTTITTTEVACTRDGGAASLRVTYASGSPDSPLESLSLFIPDTAAAETGTTEFSAVGRIGGTTGVPIQLDQGDLTDITVTDNGSAADVTLTAGIDASNSLSMTVNCAKIG